MNTNKFITLTLAFICAVSISAQQKLDKLSKTVNANKDVTLNLNTNHTNIEISTWDSNKIQVDAFVESKELSKEDLKEVLDSWDIDVEGSGANVTIESHGGFGGNYNFNFDLSGLEILKDLNLNLKGAFWMNSSMLLF